MFTGMIAFPLTPLREDSIDEDAYRRIISRLAAAGVDAIGALGSTGSYAYLDREERRQVAIATVEEAGEVPAIVGIGATRTSHVQALAEDAQEAGADAVLLAPVSYQALTGDDVFALYERVTAGLSVPLVVYDNPGTTHFTFSTDLYARIAALPNVAAIKIPPPPADEVAGRIATIRAAVPEHIRIGISGDNRAAAAMNAGADSWFSVIGGTLPQPALEITRAALAGDAALAEVESARLQPLWDLFGAHGSYRVTAALAEHLGLVPQRSLPHPILGLGDADRARLGDVIDELDLGTRIR
ncbi:dihydrodipicolinate synthase family protein [Gulosibacter molinativorax]|uniref:Dihydrodipicolinate synthase family protein n=1 Tax=Gulosibacter molinativorax TaxID=256821 RepID=A0ABT7C950_9MICO|nr:dihydrodipicolinate synthase family protein [Gulosibacter molinativorax]MDJ1371638.1 dihydrodipicolinate synthase family protein [Gulosibacter molinativorax]QUY61018.1 4-hydroxy-tetrahydrodipicolinate synthase [Gulosibacter molinativorax]